MFRAVAGYFFGPWAWDWGGSWNGRFSRGRGPGLVFASRGLGRLSGFRVMDLDAAHLVRVVLLTGVLGPWIFSVINFSMGNPRKKRYSTSSKFFFALELIVEQVCIRRPPKLILINC